MCQCVSVDLAGMASLGSHWSLLGLWGAVECRTLLSRGVLHCPCSQLELYKPDWMLNS